MIEKYPYSDFNEFNLDWVIRKIRDLETSMTDYEALHSITFGGDWDISKQYQAWTIVSDPISHDGYLSLKPVPNNVLLTDTDYWLKIADYTTGLANVNARVDAVENDITNNIDPAITNLQNDVTLIGNHITNDIDPDISNLKYEVNLMKRRRIIIFGDSYFEDGRAEYNGKPVRYWLNQYLAGTNIDFEINAQGQEGFAVTGNNSFLYDVNNYVSTFDPDEVTDVVFAGGFNDRIYTIANIESGMYNTFQAVRTKYPYAKIHCGFFGWDGHWASTNRSDIVRYAIPGWKNCGKYGASYMENSEFTMHWYELFTSADWIHPTDKGTAEIAKQLVLYLLGGSCDVHYDQAFCTFNDTGTPEAYWTDTVYQVSSKLDNDLVTIYLPEGNIIYDGSPFNCPHGSYTSLLQMTSIIDNYRLHFMGQYATEQVMNYLTIQGNFQVGVTAFMDFSNCAFIIHEGILKVRPYKINADGDGFDEVTGVIALNLIGGAITIPTLAC